MLGLTELTTYYVRAYATNANGTGYGNEITVKTVGVVFDIDGNWYIAGIGRNPDLDASEPQGHTPE